MKIGIPLLFYFSAIILLLAGCTAPRADLSPPQQIPLTLLFSAIQCGPTAKGAGAAWIDRPEQLEAVTGIAATERIQWDPEKEGALWIHMGTRPTGGYHVELDAPTASVQNGVALVRVRWQTPAPGRFSTQILTSPCLVVKLPKSGIQTILVQDQQGTTIARLAVLGRD